MAVSLNGETFEAFLAQQDKPVLVDFYRDGCLPCRRVSPLLSKAGEQYEDKLVLARVNIGQSQELAGKLKIEAAPTLIIFQEGKEAARHRGVIDRDGLNQWIEDSI
jgi:thioredoxin 1